MRVVITGAGGFIGSTLVQALLEQGALTTPDGRTEALTELALIDICEQELPAHPAGVAISTYRGDICEAALRNEVFSRPVDAVFHLAATLTAEAQADPSKGTRVNVRGMLDLLEQCRTQERPPVFAFASSVATFGGTLPEVVDDDVVQKPQTSYGSHKVIAEQLINDYTRHGVIDGRALRLPIVLIRPPSRNAPPSVSDQVAAIVREPLAGRDHICPFAADTRLAVTSVERAAQAFIRLHALSDAAFPGTRAINLPALTITPAQMVAAARAVAGEIGEVKYQPDARAQEVVDSWPQYFVSQAAQQAGLALDESFEAIVQAYMQRREE